MKQHAPRSLFTTGSKSHSNLWLILFLVPFACLCSCANDAFLPPPENLPYAQEHENDSNSEAAKLPPLMDTE